jgi:predicted phosphodiesterase
MPTLQLVGDQHIRHDNLQALPLLKQHLSSIVSQPSHIVLMGDLLDRHSHVEQPLLASADSLIRFILDLPWSPQLIILCGNHDFASNQVYLTADHWLVVYQGFRSDQLTVVDKPTVLSSLPGVLLMPYVPDGQFIRALTEHSVDWTTQYRLILGHQSLTNIKDIGHLLLEADTWQPDFPLLVSGHIHDPHWAGPNVLYVGSYIPVSNGEGNEKFLWTLRLPDERGAAVTKECLTQVPVNFLSRRTIESSTGQVMADVAEMVAHSNPNQHTRVVVSGTHAEIQAWTKGMDAAVLRAHRQVKVILKVKPEVKVAAEAASVAVEEKQLDPRPVVVLTYRQALTAAIAASAAPVQLSWARFQAAHVNLFGTSECPVQSHTAQVL